jgi:hypothetical protein
MVAKVPIRTVFDEDGNATGLAEFQSGEFVNYIYGGTGLAILGSAGQVLKVNSGGTALEYGNVEAILNIDGMTDGSGTTIADSDKFAMSDGGTEKYVLASDISSYVQSDATTFSNVTTVGALASGSITSGFGTISIGNNITTTATIEGATITENSTRVATRPFAIAQAIALG